MLNSAHQAVLAGRDRSVHLPRSRLSLEPLVNAAHDTQRWQVGGEVPWEVRCARLPAPPESATYLA